MPGTAVRGSRDAVAEDIGIDGRVALVTGAAQGIGEAVARALAERGARIAALDRHDEALVKTVARLRDDGFDASAFATDVRDSAAVEDTVHRVEEELGPVDILVNVAGVLRLGAVVDLTDEDWSTVFEVNTQGVFYTSRAVARRMVPRGRGCVVTVGSNAGSVPRARMAAYGASKAATASFTKCLGLELAGHGIRCNVVSPGSTETPMLRAMWTDESSVRATLDGSAGEYRVGIPLRKLATPWDIAEAVVFLASDRAGHITMHDLCVDGGAALGA
ncbi:2,3-dihydro-2,3-dihydroxybenzoate dehydrogenase [Streptomyces sp. NPDC002888]|uniref:2,3-dihydro-2,3-dihydroxybenzoate dehydrogenase n=1 Tax=Streptomyces sp. NPDC002888 TaxID=3364668 RepID=UPI0036A94372